MKKEEMDYWSKQLHDLAICSEDEVLYQEYVNDMVEFQEVLSALFFDGDKTARLDDITYKLKDLARCNGLIFDDGVKKAVSGLQKINKELSISMAGKKGEERIERRLGYCKRDDMVVFKNVSVFDSNEETEIDNVILTKKGILILEVKNSKCPITISEDGRLLYNNQESYHNVSIGEKMSSKRRLLRKCLEKELDSLDWDIPICMDSYIVFSTPDKYDITVTDNFNKEKYCTKNELTYVVDKFKTNEQYSSDEFEILSGCLTNMQRNSKKFQVDMDFGGIADDVLFAYELVTSATKTSPKTNVKESIVSAYNPRLRKWLIKGFATVGSIVISSVVAKKLIHM